MIASARGVRSTMPAAHPEEFRRRAVELARLREGRSPRSPRTWASASPACAVGWARPVRLRREKRVLEMEVEILKRASAYFARENILPK